MISDPKEHFLHTRQLVLEIMLYPNTYVEIIQGLSKDLSKDYPKMSLLYRYREDLSKDYSRTYPRTIQGLPYKILCIYNISFIQHLLRARIDK